MHTRLIDRVPVATVRTLAAAIALLAATAPAFATDRKVPQKYATIQKAADAARSGDRILVSAGTYHEKVVVTGKDGLKFVAVGKVVWDGLVAPAHEDCLQVTGASTLVQGFTFRAGARHVVLHGNGVAIRRCTSLSCLGNAFSVDAQTPALVVGSKRAVIDRCVIRSAQGDAISGGIESGRVTHCTITGCRGNSMTLALTASTVDRCTVSDSLGTSIMMLGSSSRLTNSRFKRIQGVLLYGSNWTVARNSVSSAAASGIRVQGDHATIDRNRVSGSVDGGIQAISDRARVTGNRVSDCGLSGIAVTGLGRHVVTGNVVSGVRVGAGITVLTDGFTPKARATLTRTLVSRNTVSDVLADGFVLQSDDTGMDATSCRAVRCGAACGSGFQVRNGSIVLDHCVATDCAGNGFRMTLDVTKLRLSGPTTVLRSCDARDCGFDGFLVGPSMRVTMSDCDASGCQGEGLDHRGSGSTFVRCQLRRNRVDYTNTGTITGPAPGHGTESAGSQVDCETR